MTKRQKCETFATLISMVEFSIYSLMETINIGPEAKKEGIFDDWYDTLKKEVEALHENHKISRDQLIKFVCSLDKSK